VSHRDAITAFLDQMGIEVREGRAEADSLLPGVTIAGSSIIYDESVLVSVGDLLHAAAQIATAPRSSRAQFSGPIRADPAVEMANIAWSYAAAVHLGVPLDVVFHVAGFKEDAKSLIENFSAGRYFGVPILRLWEMTDDEENSEVAYPNMATWVRATDDTFLSAPPRSASTEDRIRLSFRFDASRLQSDLEHAHAKFGEWVAHFVESNYEGDWSVIPLRGRADARHAVEMIYSDPGTTEFADGPILDVCPYFRRVLAQFECPIGAVRLMKLSPGSKIKEHQDFDLKLEDGFARFHVPILTNPGVEFYLNGVRVVMQVGECWYLRLSDPHHVSNNGDSDRIHLVIDAVANDWLRMLLR
jgi:hypothetical protein